MWKHCWDDQQNIQMTRTIIWEHCWGDWGRSANDPNDLEYYMEILLGRLGRLTKDSNDRDVYMETLLGRLG